MSDAPARPTGAPDSPAPRRRVPRWRDTATAAGIVTVTLPLVGAAAAWFLLRSLAPVLRPLMIAIFLAYVLMPTHVRLRRHVGSPASLGILAGATAALLIVLAFVIYANVLGLNDELPRLHARAVELTQDVEDVFGATHNLPGTSGKVGFLANLTGTALLNIAADVLVEAAVVAMYLLFLLLEGSRFPDRVRWAYPPERAEAILRVAGQVNATIVGYLRVKVRASLVLAVPVGVILWACGVKFALLWAILTFLCNFIPYLGPVAALSLPIGFSFLWYGVAWQPITAAALLVACHVASAALVEPMMIGKAVGLSPLVLLAALAFWGLLWGIPGMFLAVPLTVVAVIVMDHFEGTRPVGRLLRGN